ncbi:hypothetical protein MKX01_030638 [Papaver californicum]|nr:hypothetical protein MKX01_030638 [Papaver californicum]
MVQLPASDAVALGEIQTAFEPLIGVFHDYHVMINPYTFTVLKFPSTPPAAIAPMSARPTELNGPKDAPITANESRNLACISCPRLHRHQYT